MRSPSRTLPTFFVAASLLAVVPLAGCSATVSAMPEIDAEASSTAALVAIERTDGPGEAVRGEAVARFLRVRGGAVDSTAERTVGASLELPAIGTCAVLGGGSSAVAATVREVKLADVGGVTIETSGSRVALAPRFVPDVADLVSGVLYAGRTTDDAGLPASARYGLRVDGAPDLGIESFGVDATAPSDFADIRVAGQAPGDRGADHMPSALSLPTQGGALDVRWAAGDVRDVVYIDVVALSAASGPAVRCTFMDVGQAVVDAQAFAGLDAGQLAFHRLHRETFRAPGIESGEIRFDFARVISFVRP